MPSWQSYLVKPAARLLRLRHKGKDQTFAEQRLANDALSLRYTIPRDVNYEPTLIAGMAAAWVTTTATSTEQVILYLHGGAYALGSLLTYRPTLATVAKATGARVLAIEYRLAPEHPFPAAVDDARTSWPRLLLVERWIKSAVQRLTRSGVPWHSDRSG